MKFIHTAITSVVLALFLSSAAWANGPLVNMNVVNSDVREVLTALAAVGRVNMVTDDSVGGKITIQFHNVPFETALDIVAKTKGLTYQTLGNVVVVGTTEQMNKGFGEIHIFKLNYAKASEAAALVGVIFKDKANSPLPSPSQQGQVTNQSSQAAGAQAGTLSRLKVDEATNSLVFNGSPDEVEKIRKILDELDIPYQQVSLEAQVMSINKTASKDLGIDWKWSATPSVPEYEREKVTYKVPVYNTDGTNKLDNDGKPVSYEGEYFTWKVKRNSLDSNVTGAGVIQFGRTPEGHPYEFLYQAKISALLSNGKADILARPKVTTINGKEAVINIGEEVPVPVVTTASNGTTTNSIEYKKVGIILKYTPRVNIDGYITADVHTEVSTPVLVPEMKAYKIITRSADTIVRLKDGETMVIGGLIGKEESRAVNEVPFLSKLPLVGALFKSVHNSKTENEVIIFLTARIEK